MTMTMTMTRTTHVGKIARLSKRRREEVSRRLENGMPGGEILTWLNGRRDVKAVLRAQFGGRPVNKQNLSAWRRSGYVEWLALEAARQRVDRLVSLGDDLAARAGKRGLGDRLAILLALEMDGLMETLLKPESDPEKRWERVRQMHREVSRLRRDDDRVKRTRLREKVLEVQGPGSKVQSRNRPEEELDEESQFYEDERCESEFQGRESTVGEGGEDEDEDENEHDLAGPAAGQNESRQVKAGQGEESVQRPESKVQKAVPEVVHRTPIGDGEYESLRIRYKESYWTEVKPKGWVPPVGWGLPMDEEDVQGPRSEAQGPGQQGSGGGTPPELAGGDACGTKAQPDGDAVNSQAGKPALPGLPRQTSESDSVGSGLISRFWEHIRVPRSRLDLPEIKNKNHMFICVH